jgi:hypothetical protein
VRHGSWVLTLLLLLVGSACARGGGGETPEPSGSPARVEVTNNYPLALEIFVIGAGTTHRLGSVDPGMVGQFVIPQTMIGGGQLEFQAKPPPRSPAREQARSGPMLVAPGTIVDFVITPRLFNSTATVRP